MGRFSAAFNCSCLLMVLFAFAGAIASRAQNAPGDVLLRDFRPRSIYAVPTTQVHRARHPIIDTHSHPYAKTREEVVAWVAVMDSVNVEKTIVLTYAIGEEFDRVMDLYSGYPDRFEVWCGLDLRNPDARDFAERTVSELERCHAAGGLGIGEIHDKGGGLRSGKMSTQGLRIDDPRMQPVLERAGELGMPINIHVAEPIWMYERMDVTNDGMMNALNWRLDDKPGIADHAEMIEVLENAVRQNPGTTFIASHLMNLSYDLEQLGRLFDRYPNLYADNSARYAETAAIPRAVGRFYERYADRILYGTDMGLRPAMYHTTFRILESADEHFYDHDLFSYHWSLHGFALPDDVLRKVYGENARALFARLRERGR